MQNSQESGQRCNFREKDIEFVWNKLASYVWILVSFSQLKYTKIRETTFSLNVFFEMTPLLESSKQVLIK